MTTRTHVDALLTTSDVAERLKVHPKTAVVLIASGEIPGINIGGQGNGKRWRVRPADLERWIESRRAAA